METTTKIKNPDPNPEAPVEGEQPINREEEDERLLDSNWTETVENFEDLNLKKDLLRGVFGYGFVKPSAIQQKAIKPIIMKKDIIAQAQSGSGKIGTFVISMLQNIDHEDLKLQFLIIAPTRALVS